MRTIASWTLIALICAVPAAAAAAPKPKPLTAIQLKAQVKKLTTERDELKERLEATDGLEQDLVAAQKGRELAQQEAEGLRKELIGLKSSLNENQSGSDAILQDLQKAKADLAACMADKEILQKGMDEADTKAKILTDSGLLATIPARALNLSRLTPNVKNVSRGVVVVNVLINESGEVLDTRLIQGLPGSDIYVQKANEACLDAAKRIVFDPARSADGKTKLRVWQAVGFLVD